MTARPAPASERSKTGSAGVAEKRFTNPNIQTSFFARPDVAIRQFRSFFKWHKERTLRMGRPKP